MTRRGYVAGALVALVLLVVPLGLVPYVLAPLGADEPATAEQPRRPAGDPAVAASMSCADQAVPAPEVPADVVAARMCATENGLASWYAPQDGLHADLAPLIELLGTLEPVPESVGGDRYFCTDDGGVGFDLRLASASGGTVSVLGDTGGCSTVRIGDEDVVGSDEVLALFVELLGRQRASTEPASDLEQLPLGCGSDTTFEDHVLSRMGDPSEIVRAVSCSMPDDARRWGDATRIPSRHLAVLVVDLAQGVRNDQGFEHLTCGKDDFFNQDLVGQTRWGDVVAIRGACATYLLSDIATVAPEDQEFWHPSTASQRILDGLRR